MTLPDITEQMQLSYNKIKLLNEDIAKKRLSENPEGLKEMQREWAIELIKFRNLVNTYSAVYATTGC